MTILRECIIVHLFSEMKNHTYWKVNMYVHLLSVEKNRWCVVTEGLFIPKDDDSIAKHPKDCMNDDTKKASYDLKARNILISALSVKVLSSISHHMSAKGMQDAFQTLFEGIYDIKDSKINMFIEEFEIFLMELGEFVDSM